MVLESPIHLPLHPRDAAIPALADQGGTAAGTVAFAEQYDSGWTVTVDGQPAHLARANLITRAVHVTVGMHRIALAYHTPGLRRKERSARTACWCC
jgi:hypothetical protein